MTQTLTDLTVWISGAAGDGIASAGESFAKACSRSGYHVFAHNSYQSVIRGGHVCMHIRVGQQKVYSPGDSCNYLIALNQESINRYGKRVTPGGAVLYNSEKFKATQDQVGKDVQLIGLPVMQLIGNQLMQNVALMGALMQTLGMDPAAIRGLIQERFKKKGEAVIKTNLDAFDKAGEYAKTNAKPGEIRIGKGDGKRRPLAGGNPLIGLGAVAAGCRFYSAYPMTPASSILHWLVKYGPKSGVLVKQCEDEIAAINMAIGAGHVGVRAMTGTAGGGFALMTEAVGMAGMTETPVVIVEVQRGGPSTGLPTKTEQGDLFQVFGASQGEFPKAIFVPRTLQECYDFTVEAFNVAEKYQIPVLIMSDLYLSERLETFDGVNIAKVPVDRGQLLSQVDGRFRRFQDTPTGVAPRALPGTPGAIFTAATDEHDEDGIVISDVFTNPAIRVKMMRKRMRKMDFLAKELKPPTVDGPADADLTLVSWGSTYQVLLEAMNALNKEGLKVNVFCLNTVWPFPTEAVKAVLSKTKLTLTVEANYTGQIAKFIAMETGIVLPHHLRKYDGEPFEPKQVIDYARKLLKTKPAGPTVESLLSDEGVPADFSPIEHPPVGVEVARQH